MVRLLPEDVTPEQLKAFAQGLLAAAKSAERCETLERAFSAAVHARDELQHAAVASAERCIDLDRAHHEDIQSRDLAFGELQRRFDNLRDEREELLRDLEIAQEELEDLQDARDTGRVAELEEKLRQVDALAKDDRDLITALKERVELLDKANGVQADTIERLLSEHEANLQDRTRDRDIWRARAQADRTVFEDKQARLEGELKGCIEARYVSAYDAQSERDARRAAQALAERRRGWIWFWATLLVVSVAVHAIR